MIKHFQEMSRAKRWWLFSMLILASGTTAFAEWFERRNAR